MSTQRNTFKFALYVIISRRSHLALMDYCNASYLHLISA